MAGLSGWIGRRFDGLTSSISWVAGGFRWLVEKLARPAVFVPLLVAAIVVSQIPAPPFWFPTDGIIRVESPEVYTRERLVNDRYRQDFWLKDQLERLDDATEFISRNYSSRVEVGAELDPATLPKAEELALAFQEEFALRMATRDRIRQLILENLLDDRHDLTGNSIYGLKFDTAIIPGANTHKRPYVRVWLDYAPFKRADGSEAVPEYYLTGQDEVEAELGTDPFAAAKRQFDGWQRDVQGRLNQYLEALLRDRDRFGREWCEPAPAGAEALAAAEPPQGAANPTAANPGQTRVLQASAGVYAPLNVGARSPINESDRLCVTQTLAYVLGVHPREVAIGEWTEGHASAWIALPEPWVDFFTLELRPDVRGGGYYFELGRQYVAFYLADAADWEAYRQNLPKPSTEEQRSTPPRFVSARLPSRIKRVAPDGSESEVEVVPAVDTANTVWALTPVRQRRVTHLTRSEIEMLDRRGKIECWPGPNECELRARRIFLDMSLYNFISAVSEIDAYSYAVFPRGDVEGVLSTEAVAARAALPHGEGKLGLGSVVSALSATAERKVVNFAGGRQGPDADDDRRRFDFGWAVVKDGKQRPDQVSQLVLVSVPAYLDRVNLTVETGWLGRNGEPRPVDERRLTVVLPPDYEALDTLVVGGTRRNGPVVDYTLMQDEIRVLACAPASIVIPGERLWRSTTVTLSGQVADEITVMPNMRGIVARFDEVNLPPPRAPEPADEKLLATVGAAPEPARAAPKMAWTEEELTVWTSEGAVQLRNNVHVLVPGQLAEGRQTACPSRTAQGATALPAVPPQ